MISNTFKITFHTPFAIDSWSTETAAVIELAALRGSSLKGLMRSAASGSLGLPAHIIDEVFGSSGRRSPWAWSGASALGLSSNQVQWRSRICVRSPALRSDQAAVIEDLVDEEVEFTVTQHDHIAASDLLKHTTVLRCSAAAVHSLGRWRNRGLGWVGVTPEPAITADDVLFLTAVNVDGFE